MVLILTEVRRGLARRAVRVLITVAVLGIVVIGSAIFANAEKEFVPAAQLEEAQARRAQDVKRCRASGGFDEAEGATGAELARKCNQLVQPASAYIEDDRFFLTDLWPEADEGDDDGILQATALFLIIGALIGGATFMGGEWRWGTVATLLTWEPRRRRVFGAKVAAAGGLAFLIGVVLQALVALAVLPAAVWRGTTSGADVDWAVGAVGAGLRAAALAAGAAVLAAAIASIGRNTAAALGAGFAYMAVAEPLMRDLKPGWADWFVGENATRLLTARPVDGSEFTRGTLGSALVLAAYVTVLAVVASLQFEHRDVT